MLSARHSPSAGIELAGSPEGLADLAGELAAGGPVSLPLDGPPLGTLEVRRSGGPLRVHADGRTLVLAGAAIALHWLARRIGALARDGGRLHVEWEPGSEAVAEDSEPLTVTLAPSSGA